MKNIKIGNMSMVYTADDANTLYTMAQDRAIKSAGSGLDIYGMVKGREFQIDGKIYTDFDAVRIGSSVAEVAQVDFTLGAKGRIQTSDSGIVSYGADHVIRIDGKIDAADSAIETHGAQRIVNTGELSGNVGINVYSISEHAATITNTGSIEGTQYSIYGSSATDKVINNGDLTGAVNLSGGDDMFVYKGGTIDGVVRGGIGDDTYVARVANLNVVEGFEEGFDTVRSTVSYTLQSNVEKLSLIGKANIDGVGTGGNNELYGNAGKNHLSAGDGFDLLNGGKGNDVLEGGVGSDEFYFQKGTGKDAIADYEAGFDELHFYYLDGATNFADMIEDHAVEKNGDVVITFGKDSIVLKDHVIADLQEADFHFYS